MTSLDAQIEDQYIAELIPVINRVVATLSDEYVFKMIFVFSDLLSPDEYQHLWESAISKNEKILLLVKLVLKHLKLTTNFSINIWGELLFLTKLYKYLKAHRSCKHQMKTQSLRGAKFFSSDIQRLLLCLCDNLTDEDVNYIWRKSLDGTGSFQQQPEMLFHQLCFVKKINHAEILNELRIHLTVLGRNELIDKIQQYMENIEGASKIRELSNRAKYDLNPCNLGGICGVALIFNNKTFNKMPHPEVRQRPLDKLTDRNGTDRDAARLDCLWKSYGMASKIYNDKCSTEFNCILNDWLKRDLSLVKIFVVCILTHGENGIVYMSDRIGCSTMDVQVCLGRSQQLAGKPKLLFIQACQGHSVQAKGENSSVARRVELDGPLDQLQSGTPVAQQSDMLIGLATVPGFMSIRNIRDGTHFIQTLVNTLEESGTKEDISGLITEINHKVGNMWANAEINGNKLCLVQMPTFHNQLTKQLIFNKVNPRNES